MIYNGNSHEFVVGDFHARIGMAEEVLYRIEKFGLRLGTTMAIVSSGSYPPLYVFMETPFS